MRKREERGGREGLISNKILDSPVKQTKVNLARNYDFLQKCLENSNISF